MKKFHAIMTFLLLILSCLSLTACGGKKDSDESIWRGIQAGMEDLSAITDRTEYYDIVTEQEAIFQWEPEKEGSPLSAKTAKLINMQFYQGEPIQFWMEPNLNRYGLIQSWNICLYSSDGSRRALMSGISLQSTCHGYLDQEGNFYFWINSAMRRYSDGRTETSNTFLKKYDPSGKLLYEKEFDYDYDIQEINQTADGRVYLYISGKDVDKQGARRLAELDPVTGNVTEFSGVSLSKELTPPHFGIWGEKLVMFKMQSLLGNEVAAINVDNGSEEHILSFQGTSYVTPTGFILQDFQILEDESVEILWAVSNGSESLRERLRMEKVERTPIVLRGVNINGWLSTQINSFNRQSGNYHVIVEDCGQGNDVEDFARLTSVQIASGKGPDIIGGGLMKDYMSGLMEKGILEDLRPYMERSGIREEDYFPFAFAAWRDGDRIYSVSPTSPSLAGYRMDSAVLGGTGEPDIETLVNALLAGNGQQAGNAVFLEGYDSQKLLEFLLKGSETLWGMVDWEKGSCDFSGELFTQILEVAKRYGDSKDSGTVNFIAEGRSRFFSGIYLFDDMAERERDGKTICGVLFDDGCHVAVSPYSVLAVNADSTHKEGVWEFISFLLGDEAQSASKVIPASRKAFDVWVEEQKEKLADGKEIHMMYYERLTDGSSRFKGTIVYTEADITEEIIEEYVETLEDAHPYPIRTAPILDIISEEAADYFNGSKSAAEVARLVANRVQTYLDEGR